MRTRLRRYPALGFLAVAALLASLLPSALRVPLSGPTASAELAPVPGKSDVAQGDLTALGETSTGGLGSGSGLGGLGRGRRGPGGRQQADGGPGDPPGDGSGRKFRTKRCVGDPPRQTEDPLSPPCVAYFEGDNGGATAKGVTEDEIVVAYEDTWCSTEGKYADYDDPDDPNLDPDVAAYLRHFNERFQLYGRRVHLYGVGAPCFGTTPAASMAEIDQRLKPFYIFSQFIPLDRSWGIAAAEQGIIATLPGPKRETTLHRPPYILSYEPDHDDLMASAAEFLCARLAGRPARFAGDPTYHGRTRKFGLVYGETLDPTNEGPGWFLDRVRSRCGQAAGEIVVGYVRRDGEDFTTMMQRRQQAVARMRLEGVTTIVFMEGGALFPNEVDGAKWYPEWFVPDGKYGAAGINVDARTPAYPPGQMRNAFGMTSMRRYGPPAEQPHELALREGCPSCAGPGWLYKYDRLLLLFWGIQAAGPRLTPANLDKGLHALPARRSLDPFTPAAYFAPGNYSFVKDWATVWWDPTGVPPGTSTPGCWRLVEDGLRYRTEDWHKRPGDDGIQDRSAGQPCQGDVGKFL